jgi:hypothetical protein
MLHAYKAFFMQSPIVKFFIEFHAQINIQFIYKHFYCGIVASVFFICLSLTLIAIMFEIDLIIVSYETVVG